MLARDTYDIQHSVEQDSHVSKQAFPDHMGDFVSGGMSGVGCDCTFGVRMYYYELLLVMFSVNWEVAAATLSVEDAINGARCSHDRWAFFHLVIVAR
jgi:hypothetical protein